MSSSHLCTASRLRWQRGVGIIEILVAVLVLSIGLLGLAGLQMRTLRNNESALERGVAVVETHAIADAMRADRDNARNGTFDIAIDDPAPAGATFADVVVAGWRQNLISALGADATGSVDCNGTLCDIVIRWNDSRGSGDAVALETFTINTQVQL
jgi:type IV pilus assembly protein PilV